MKLNTVGCQIYKAMEYVNDSATYSNDSLIEFWVCYIVPMFKRYKHEYKESDNINNGKQPCGPNPIDSSQYQYDGITQKDNRNKNIAHNFTSILNNIRRKLYTKNICESTKLESNRCCRALVFQIG